MSTPSTAPAGDLRAFTIYDSPTDHPGRFVVRGFTLRRGHEVPDPLPWAVCDTLDEARASLPDVGLVALSRDPADPPAIVETWL